MKRFISTRDQSDTEKSLEFVATDLILKLSVKISSLNNDPVLCGLLFLFVFRVFPEGTHSLFSDHISQFSLSRASKKKKSFLSFLRERNYASLPELACWQQHVHVYFHVYLSDSSRVR